MKKITLFILAVCLLLTMAACGSSSPAAPVETPVPATPTPAPTAAPAATETPVATPEPEEDVSDLIAAASEFIDRPVEELYDAIGMPESSDYASSCLGPGEDGNLYYDGFIVYTYREGNVETVRFVE